jgi:hypothetical protein
VDTEAIEPDDARIYRAFRIIAWERPLACSPNSKGVRAASET